MSLDLIPDKKTPLLKVLDQRFLDKYGLRAEPDKSGVGWWLTADDKNWVALDGSEDGICLSVYGWNNGADVIGAIGEAFEAGFHQAGG